MNAPETSELQAFIRIADAGSVSAASNELNLPRATISRRLARLEDRLGVRLMHRTTRKLRLTDSGEEFYRHARAIVLAVDAASEAVRRNDGLPRGLLRVSVPPLTNVTFRTMLIDFMERFGEIELEVSSSTRHVDLVASNIDVALRAGTHISPGVIARRLFYTELLAVASPEYLARAGVPRSADELKSHVCLVGFAKGERPATHWPLRDGERVRVHGRLVSNEMLLIADAARRGFGIALVPAPFTTDDRASGALVPVLPDVLGATSTMALVYPNRRLLKPAVRAFVDFVVEWTTASPLWNADTTLAGA